MSQSSVANFSLRRNIPFIFTPATTGNYFLIAAKGTEWPDESSPPTPDNSVALNEYDIFDEMLFGKYVSNANIKHCAARYDWIANTIYAKYDDEDPVLFSKNFYVLTSETSNYHVFKCLNNNGGAPSVYQPLLAETDASDIYYETADGYQWKYMYSFDSTAYDSYATPSYIPVTPNTSVTANAIDGSISSYTIEAIGSNYLSVTNGYFVDVSVGGNNQYFGIQGPDTTILAASPNTYTVGQTITQLYSGIVASGTVASESSNSTVSILTLRNVSNQFLAGANSIQSNTASSATLFDVSTPDVSSNSNFYNGCSIYISSGTGAGQIGKIDEYIVDGQARRVLLANSFAIQPDLTSKYIISPRVFIQGDGEGAVALSVIDTGNKSLKSVMVINVGTGYTYANVSVIGNTGSTAVVANNASVRAIISPRGGHGYDPYSELAATYVEYAGTFANTENGNIPGTGTTYRRTALLVNPRWQEVTLTYSYDSTPAWPLATNATVVGATSNAVGYISTYNGTANTVTLANVSGLFEPSEILTSYYANGSVATPASSNVQVTNIAGQYQAFDQRTLLQCLKASLVGLISEFAVGKKIVQTEGGVDTAFGIVQEISSDATYYYIYLTEAKGTFVNSDIPTSAYKYIYDDATRTNSLRVDEISLPDLIPYTGEIMYVENHQAVTRNSSQSETVQLILGFN